jgi:hypothetical protein
MAKLGDLPQEVFLNILSFLSPSDLVRVQQVSRCYLRLGRDKSLWKAECFTHSRAETLRRRQQLLGRQPAHLAVLRNAVSALPGGDLTAWDVSLLRGSPQPTSSRDPEAEAKRLHARALANWEPAYPGEHFDYYEEFIHRHAPTNVGWLNVQKGGSNDKEALREVTGIGTLNHGLVGSVSHAVTPLDDGSICIWDVTAASTSSSGGRGRLLARSRSGLLSGRAPEAISESHTIMTETGAVECVSIDSHRNKGYFAVQSFLHEVDLNTLQLTSTREYPFAITALSEASTKAPITVGTNWTIHLNDPRDPAFGSSITDSAGGELIGGAAYSHATLEQPGPLSILHDYSNGTPDDSSIWVAGRFTSLINYDRRFFPRLRGTIFSGARIASLASLPYPLIPRDLDLLRNPDASRSALDEAKRRPGITILAAAEYKGKGSLELYGLLRVQPYQNRQTASASKLLSVAPHGGQIVFSDGDGNLKWVERDGFSFVRTFNINDAVNPTPDAGGSGQSGDASAYGIWSSTASELPGQGDIVQKIIPTNPVTASSTSHNSGTEAGIETCSRPDIHSRSSLLLWTGDGRVGLLGFGHKSAIGEGVESGLEERAMNAAERAREDAEREYGMAMRRALERNADEVRFVTGLGLGR